MDLSPILDTPLAPGTKGIPASGYGLPLGDVAGRAWRLLAGEVPLPAAILRQGAIDNNLTALHRYLALTGMSIAPHGKTTMCPQLFSRQIEGGAWGITVATFAQAMVALRFGVKNILLANQLIGDAEIRAISEVYDSSPDVLFISFVDSTEGIQRISDVLTSRAATRQFDVMVEVGIEGRRCGVRNMDDALQIAKKCSAATQLRLRGVAGYEGVLVSNEPEADARAVDSFMTGMVSLFVTCRNEGLFCEKGTTYVSAGGSAYFDIVAKHFSTITGPSVVPLLRSGCYLSHDSGFYQALLEHVDARHLLGAAPALKPALQVWAQVVSRPEKGLAIIGAGRRDLSDDAGMPKIESWARPGPNAMPLPVEGWSLFKMNDQHGYVRIPESVDLRIGDYVAMGISHPCTTFDKWGVLLEVDEQYVVVNALKTFF